MSDFYLGVTLHAKTTFTLSATLRIISNPSGLECNTCKASPLMTRPTFYSEIYSDSEDLRFI